MPMQSYVLAGPPNGIKIKTWIEPNTGRMLITPGYHDETVSGWTLRYYLGVDMYQGGMSRQQLQLIKDKYSDHSHLYKRALVDETSISRPGSTGVFRLLRHAIHYITDGEVRTGGVKTLYRLWENQRIQSFADGVGSAISGLRIDRQAGVTHTNRNGVVRHMVNIQLQYGSKSYAGILIQAGKYNTRMIAHGLTRSLYEGRMMMVHMEERLGSAGRNIVEAILIDGSYRKVIGSWIKGQEPDRPRDEL
ncbi:hypothetical protein BGZ76_007496 [Entomortierella beljakovae]|nr:hypothetical protein BGZ76_007496 [Entomortierella beljakovae]